MADGTVQDGARRSTFTLSTGCSYPGPLDPQFKSVPAPSVGQTGTKHQIYSPIWGNIPLICIAGKPVICDICWAKVS